MRNDWLTTVSFERMHEVISAVNVLSIHAKLAIAGTEDPIKESEIREAQDCLLTFLESLQELLQDTEQSHNGTIVNSDPRMGNLALYYRSQRQHLSQKASVYNLPFDDLKDLVKANDLESLRSLIVYLGDLRSLIDQHTYADVVDLLGDV